MQKLEMVMSLIDNYSNPMKGITEHTVQLAEETKAAQKTLNALQSTGKKAERFSALKKEVSETQEAFLKAKAESDRLKAAISAQGPPTKALTREYKKAKKATDKLERKRAAEAEKLQKLRQELEATGFSTADFARQNDRLAARTKEASAALERQQAALEGSRKEQERIEEIKSQSKDLAKSAAADAVALGGTIYAAKSLVKAYGEIGSAQGEIASLGISDAGIEAITEQARAFSNEWAGTTTPDFIKASYDIKSGISSLSDVAVGEFTRIAALTATGTKSSVGEMTDLFATGYAIYRDQFEDFAAQNIEGFASLDAAAKDAKFAETLSAGIASSVQAFKTDGGKLSQFVQTLGASATQAGQSMEEQLAVGGMLSSIFQGGQAATKYASFIASAGAAGVKMGLDFHDANGNLKSTADILGVLRDEFGDTLSDFDKQTLKKAFGTKEAVDMIDVLLPKIDELRDGQKKMGASLQTGTELTEKMAAAIGKGTNESLEVLDQRLFNTAASLGRVLAPSLLMAVSVVGDLANAFADLLDKHQWLSTAIAASFTAFVAYKGVMMTTKLALAALGSVKAFYATVTNAATLATWAQNAAMLKTAIATRGMAVAQTALNFAMSANPLALVIKGIAIAVGALLTYWDDIKAFFSFFGGDDKKTLSVEQTQKTVSAIEGGGAFTPKITDKRLPASAGAQTIQDQRSISINVEKLPAEMDEAMLAKKVVEEMDRRENDQAREFRGAFA